MFDHFIFILVSNQTNIQSYLRSPICPSDRIQSNNSLQHSNANYLLIRTYFLRPAPTKHHLQGPTDKSVHQQHLSLLLCYHILPLDLRPCGLHPTILQRNGSIQNQEEGVTRRSQRLCLCK